MQFSLVYTCMILDGDMAIQTQKPAHKTTKGAKREKATK